MKKMLVNYLISVFAMALFGITHASAQHQSHGDTIINYKTCDGRDVTARWEGDSFHHTYAGAATGHVDAAIWYLTWDKTCWQARWDKDSGRFLHRLVSGGPEHSDKLLNYLTWDSTKWSAVRTSTGFHHVFIAEVAAAPTPNILKRVVNWLQGISSTPGGAALVDALSPYAELEGELILSSEKIAQTSTEVSHTGMCISSENWACRSGSSCQRIGSGPGQCCPNGTSYSRVGFCKKD